MDLVLKVVSYAVVGIILVTINIWFGRAVYQSFVPSGGVVIAPVKLIGAKDAVDGETLARMLIARVQAIEWDLQHSQDDLLDAAKSAPPSSAPLPAVIPPFPAGGIIPPRLGTSKTQGISARLFETTNIDVKVAGVDVGGLLPRVQRWFVEDRILSFSVSYQDKSAIVAGSLSTVDDSAIQPLWKKIDDATTEAIADEIAFALIQRKRAKDIPQLAELTTEEFKKLVHSVSEAASVSRRKLALDVAARASFESVLADVGPLADSLPKWPELTQFAATIAENAGKYDRALAYYASLKTAAKPPMSAAAIDAKIAAINTLVQQVKQLQPQIEKSVADKLHEDLVFAVGVFEHAFATKIALPEIKLLAEDFRNAYWDGTRINLPPVAKDMPDLTYHEAAWPFVQSAWEFEYSNQAGALAASYMDILTSIAKQARLNQTAETADWLIAPGAIAWLLGKPSAVLSDRRPLRSMKEPGKAYDDPQLGKDPQVDSFSKLVTDPLDNGGVHTNSGIGNKAFYETAIKIGTEKAADVWIKSLRKFSKNTDLPTAARLIHATAKELYGEAEQEAVKAGWAAVGISIAPSHERRTELRHRTHRS